MPSASERAYESIRAMILDGTIAEGAPLREKSLADELGVSRTPIREALRRLAADGLITIETNRGAQVRSWPPEALDEIFGLRALIEGRGARIAATRAHPPATDQLRGLAEEMLELARDPHPADLDRVAELNNHFHRGVLELSESPYLLQLREDLIQLPLIRRTFQRYSQRALDRSLRHHIELVDALTAADGDWAEAVMRSHILGARHALATDAGGRDVHP